MKRILILSILMLVTLFSFSCDDSGDDDAGTGAIQVTATFTNGGTNTNITTGTKEIYVYVFSTSPTTGRSDCVQRVATSTGSAVVSGTPYTITITDLAVGSYYVLAMYDGKTHDSGANIPGRYDPYEFYSNAVRPATATLVKVDKDSTNSISISFDETNYFADAAAFN